MNLKCEVTTRYSLYLCEKPTAVIELCVFVITSSFNLFVRCPVTLLHMWSDLASHVPYSLHHINDKQTHTRVDNLQIVEVLEAALDLHMLMLRVGECVLDAKLQRLSCNTQILNVIILKLSFTNLFFFIIYQWLLLECLIDG